MGVPFIVWGFLKLRGGEAKLVPGLRALGLPDATFFAYLIGVCELVGGLGIVLGYPLRTFAVLLGVWCVVTGLDAHRSNLTEMLKNISMMGGFFALAVAGAGAFSMFGGTPPGILGWLP